MKRIFSLFTFLLVAQTLFAVPARPGRIAYKQPDGTVLQVTLRGDEHFHWYEAADGTPLRAEADGFLRPFPQDAWQQEAQKARLKAYNMRQAAANTEPSARAVGLQVSNSFPTKGRRKLLMLLLNYSDTTPLYTQEDFQQLMNAKGYKGIGSFRDYYLEQSYGQLDIEVTVTPWINLFYQKAHYGADGAIAMITEALQALPDGINLADYDNDGDGILDGLAVIHQGLGFETSGQPTDIWSHSSEIYGITRDGVTLRRYTIEPELVAGTRMTNIGVLCHEFGHNLGAPDFYDSDYGQEGVDYFGGTGTYDLMASGAWNGEMHYGERPAGINMWQKIQFGWVEPITLTETQHIDAMPAASESPTAYLVPTTIAGEYFVLENRQQQGAFDVAIPGSGLLVYRVDEAIIRNHVEPNTINAAYPQGLYLVAANAPSDPDGTVAGYGDPSAASTPFPGTLGITSLTDETAPSLRSTTGRMTYASLRNIGVAEGRVHFDFVKEASPAMPENLRADVIKGVVTLTWDIADASTVQYYNVFRNGVPIAQVTSPTYVDRFASKDFITTYTVDAVHLNGLISPYAQISTRVPLNFVERVEYTLSDEGLATLRPVLPTCLTRLANLELPTFQTVAYNSAQADFSHFFSATDLLTYKGAKITRITFLPVQAPVDVSFSVRVWETKADGTETLLSETAVKEFAIAGQKEVVLDRPVTIVAGRGYRIGVHCTSRVGNCEFMVIPSPLVVAGCGNAMRLSDDAPWTPCTDAAGNFYLAATLSLPTPNKPTALSPYPTVDDAARDLSFPIGFRIYRDGVEVGTTGNCVFVDDTPLQLGVPCRYAISSVYKGDNESVPTEITLIHQPSALHTPHSTPHTPHSTYDLQGRQVLVPQRGIYIMGGKKVVKP